MKHTKLKVILGLFTGLFLGFGLLNAHPVDAAIISPPYNDEVYLPGKSYTGGFTIFFTEQDPEILYLSLAKLEISDITGAKQARYVPAEEPELANWTKLDRLFAQKPAGVTYTNGDNAVQVNFRVDIPADAPPGGAYAVVIISNVPVDPELLATGGPVESGLGVGADLTYQLLSEIEGDVTYHTELVDFRTKDRQWLFSHLPVDFETIFQNTGNVHVIPRGNIEIFQRDIKLDVIALNSPQLRVFPNKSRLYENVWSEENIEEMEDQQLISQTRAGLPSTFIEHVIYEIQNFRIGQFTAELQGYAGAQPQFFGRVTFWVIPWHLLLVILAALLLLYLGWRLKYGRKGGGKKVSKSSAKYKKAKKGK